MYQYQQTAILGTARIMLESIHIMETSNNIDIITARHKTIKENIIQQLSSLKDLNEDRYFEYLLVAIEKYMEDYYDRQMSKVQLEAIHFPENISIDNIFKTSVAKSAIRAYRIQSDAIKSLKKESAIESRKVKFFELMEKSKNALCLASNKSGIEAIESLIDKLISFIADGNYDEEINIAFED